MIRLFASDLDGTLLNALHRTDPVVLRSIARVRQAGLRFSLATGRTLRSGRQMGFASNVCVVCANGAIVLDEGGAPIRTRSLDPAFVQELAAAFPTAPLEFVTVRHTYHLQSLEQHRASLGNAPLARRIVMRAPGLVGPPEHVYGVTPAQLASLDVLKVNAHLQGPGLAQDVHAFLARHADVATNAPFDPCMFEITAAGVNKGEALAWLAARLGIAEDEVAVYGDGGNDVVMLERFRHAYATANGSPAAKRAAGTVIGPCATYAVPRHVVRTLRAQGSLSAAR